MTRKSIDTNLDVTTWIVEAELADGMQVCFPLADATLIAGRRWWWARRSPARPPSSTA